ncbi:MAG: hypothetical protein Q9179_003128 [Wetmoreana sp. 5 TL-2023]
MYVSGRFIWVDLPGLTLFEPGEGKIIPMIFAQSTSNMARPALGGLLNNLNFSNAGQNPYGICGSRRSTASFHAGAPLSQNEKESKKAMRRQPGNPDILAAKDQNHSDKTTSNGRNDMRVSYSPRSDASSTPPLTGKLKSLKLLTDDLNRTSNLPHLNATSEVHQISVGHKAPTKRTAMAVGFVSFSNAEPLRLIKEHLLEKGDVLAVARVAGIMAVKNTSNLIPLAHNNVAVEGCSVALNLVGSSDEQDGHQQVQEKADDGETGEERSGANQAGYGGVRIEVSCESTGKTGVEMEAMSGVVGAALTVVDMCKGVDKRVAIRSVRAVGKQGGQSGSWGIYSEAQKEH